MKRICLILLLSLVSALLLATTYYIDYNAADDSANGTSTDTPWKRHPYMATFSGTYVHSAGDQFIFKGGVTWPNACFRMHIVAGGSGAGTRDYYGVDASWYTGGAWARPIWDMEDTETASTNCVMDFDNGISYVTVDNIEVTQFYWTGATSYGDDVIFQYRACTYFTFQTLYIHSWTHGTTGAGTTDQALIFNGNTSAPFGTGCIIEDCIADGSEVADSMCFNYGGCPIIRNNTIHDVTNGMFSVGNSYANHLCYGNDIYNIRNSFDAAQHENGITIYGPGKTYNNKIHDLDAGMPLYPGPSIDLTEDMLIYNNIVWNIPDTYAITVDNETGDMTGTIYILNNTFRGYSGTGACLRVQDRGYSFAKVVIQNNHWITAAADATAIEAEVTILTEDHNLKQTDAEATAEGYVEGNEFAPTDGEDSTIDGGISQSGYFTLDILGVSRPQGVIWDMGAYEYPAGMEEPPEISKVVMVLLSQIFLWIILPILLLISSFEGYLIWRMNLIIKSHEARIRFFEDGANFEAWYELHHDIFNLEEPR